MKKYKIVLCFIFTVIFLTSCSKVPAKTEVNQDELTKQEVKVSEIMALAINGDKEKVLKINNKDYTEEENISSVKDLKYNVNSNVKVYLNAISAGRNLTKTYISIFNKEKIFYLKKSFSYMDMRLSDKGSKVAFRSFSNDSLTSPEGVSVYSTVSGKKLNFDKKVIISGDLYRWQDDDNLLYYGITSSKGSSYGAIYNYDFKTNNKSVKFDKFQGYCTYFMPMKNGDIIYIENHGDNNNLNYYDAKQDKVTFISNIIDQIDDFAIDDANSIVYFIGKEAGASSAALYKLNLNDKQIERLTFDFPAVADKTGGMAIDGSGRVYFCGSEIEYGASYIYMYNAGNNSTNLITKKSAYYHIVSQR